MDSRTNIYLFYLVYFIGSLLQIQAAVSFDVTIQNVSVTDESPLVIVFASQELGLASIKSLLFQWVDQQQEPHFDYYYLTEINAVPNPIISKLQGVVTYNPDRTHSERKEGSGSVLCIAVLNDGTEEENTFFIQPIFSGCIISLDYNTTQVEEGDMFTMTCSWTPQCDLQTDYFFEYYRWSKRGNRGYGLWVKVAEFSASSNVVFNYSSIYSGIGNRAHAWFSGPLSHSITITNTTFFDGERWFVRHTQDNEFFWSNNINLVVTVTPLSSDIAITRQNTGPVFADSSETFTCHVPRLFPKALIIWNINGETFNGSSTFRSIHTHYPYITYTMNGEVTYNVTYGQRNLSVSCILHKYRGVEAVEVYPDNQLDFEVMAPPKGTPILTLSTTTLRIGTQSTLTCTLEISGYPETTTTFYINETIIGESSNDVLLFTPNTIFVRNPVVWCRKENNVGQSFSSNIIEIKVEAPSTLEYISTNVTGIHDIQKGVTLVCIASGTNVNIAWKIQDRNLPNHLFHTQKNSAIFGTFAYDQKSAIQSEVDLKTSDEVDFSCDDIDRFEHNIYCEISDVAHNSTIMSNPINIDLLHHPIRTREPEVHQTCELGVNKYLTCSVCANPPVGSYKWYFNNQPLIEKYTLSLNGTLGIGSVAQDDFGTYTCTVTNDVGVRQFSFLLTRTDEEITAISTKGLMGNAYFIGMIVTSGVIAVSLIICIVMVVLLCRKTSLPQRPGSYT